MGGAGDGAEAGADEEAWELNGWWHGGPGGCGAPGSAGATLAAILIFRVLSIY